MQGGASGTKLELFGDEAWGPQSCKVSGGDGAMDSLYHTHLPILLGNWAITALQIMSYFVLDNFHVNDGVKEIITSLYL